MTTRRREEAMDLEEDRLALERLRQLLSGGGDRASLSSDPELGTRLRELLEFVEHGPLDVDPLLGQTLAGRLRLDRLAGEGGMGRVYAATHLGLGRQVAVKVIGKRFLHDANAPRRFEQEARAAGQLDHDHVIDVLDFGVDQGRHYLVMEWVDGTDLGRWLEHVARTPGALPGAGDLEQFLHEQSDAPVGPPAVRGSYWGRVASLLADVARALAAAHARGTVHRDVKPHDILLTREGQAKLADFGLASIPSGEQLSVTGGPLGTEAYRAPEQVGAAQATPAMDIYGLGATLFHLITFRTPFQGSRSTIADQVARRLPPQPRDLVPEIPRDLEAICWKAIEWRPTDRHACAAELAEDLEAFAERRPVRSRMPSPPGRAVRWCQRHPARATSLLLAALLTVAAGAAGDLLWDRHLRAQAESRQARLSDALAALPPMLGHSVDPDLPTPDDPQAGRTARLLETAVALGADPLIVWQAAVHASRHGTPEQATAWVDRLEADGHGSPLLDQMGAVLGHADAAVRQRWPRFDELAPAVTALDHGIRGFLALAFDDWDAAWRELSLADARDTGSGLYRGPRSVAAFARGDLATAVLDAQSVEERHGPTAHTGAVLGAVLLVQSNRMADDPTAAADTRRQALGHIRSSLALCPDQVQPLNNLGRAFRDISDEPDIEPEVAEAARRSALRTWSRLLALRPDARTTRVNLAELLRDQGRWEHALAILESGLEHVTTAERSALITAMGRVHDRWAAALQADGDEQGRCLQSALVVERMQAAGRLGSYDELALHRALWHLGQVDTESTLIALGAVLRAATQRSRLDAAANVAHEIGRVHHSSGNPEGALPFLRLSLDLGREDPVSRRDANHRLQHVLLDLAADRLDAGQVAGAVGLLADPALDEPMDARDRQRLEELIALIGAR